MLNAFRLRSSATRDAEAPPAAASTETPALTPCEMSSEAVVRSIFGDPPVMRVGPTYAGQRCLAARHRASLAEIPCAPLSPPAPAPAVAPTSIGLHCPIFSCLKPCVSRG